MHLPLNKGRASTHAFVMELADGRPRERSPTHAAHARFAEDVVLLSLEHGRDSVTAFDYDV